MDHPISELSGSGVRCRIAEYNMCTFSMNGRK